MTTAQAADALAELLDPVNRADPYAAHAALRAAGPVLLADDRPVPVALVGRYAHCAALLRDPRLSVAPPGGAPMRSFLFLDPPDHTRLRRLVSAAFTPRMVEGLRPRITALVDELLDAALPTAGRAVVEVVDAVASPLPVRVICDLLGVPTGDVERFRAWSSALAEGLDLLIAPGTERPEGLAARARAAAELQGHLREVIAARRDDPGEDLLSALIAVRDGADVLDDDELLATCALLLLAGHETSVNLISGGLRALLRLPGELDALRAEPGRAPGVVEEVLRLEPPFQLVTRRALADVEVGGVVLPEGCRVVLLLAAANRDPDRFPDPDRFVPGRSGRHLAFGAGVHYCLGAPLAKLEADVALGALARRLVDPELVADPPRYRAGVTLRGPAELHVRTGPGATTPG